MIDADLFQCLDDAGTRDRVSVHYVGPLRYPVDAAIVLLLHRVANVSELSVENTTHKLILHYVADCIHDDVNY